MCKPYPSNGHTMTNRQNARRRAAVALLIAAALVACQADSPVAPRQASFSVLGKTDAAQACQNSGYQSLRRADGSEFKKVGDCVSYVAQGGLIILSFVLNSNNCFDANYTAIFSGGTGTVAGQPVTSGVPFNVNTFYNSPTLTVTGPGGSVTVTGPWPQLDGGCLS
jgi:hypothetical protein